MKNKNLVRNRFLKAGVAVLLLLPSVNFAEDVANAQNQFQTDLSRVQGDIQAGSVAPTPSTGGAPSGLTPDQKKTFEMLVTMKGMKEAIETWNTWRDKLKGYENQKKAKQDEVSSALKKQVNDADQTIAAANAMNNPVSGSVGAVTSQLDPNKQPDSCKNVDIGPLKQDLSGFDQLVSGIQGRMKADGESDKKKADEAFDKNLAKLYTDRMGKVAGEVLKLLPDGIEQLFAATKDENPKLLLQFIQKNVPSVKDAAQAARVEYWEFLTNPKTGAIATLRKAKAGSAQVATTAQLSSQMVEQQAARVANDIQEIATQDAKACRVNKKKFKKQTASMIDGFMQLVSKYTNPQQVASTEDATAKQIADTADCSDNGESAASEIRAAASSCSQMIKNETKNPQNLRTLIVQCLQSVAETAVNSSKKVAQGPAKGCATMANAITGQKDDAARAEALDVAKNGPPQDPNAQAQAQAQQTQQMLTQSMMQGNSGGAGNGGINPALLGALAQSHGQQPAPQGRPTAH